MSLILHSHLSTADIIKLCEKSNTLQPTLSLLLKTKKKRHLDVKLDALYLIPSLKLPFELLNRSILLFTLKELNIPAIYLSIFTKIIGLNFCRCYKW